MTLSIDVEEIRLNLKEWCYAKRRENEMANPQWPLFNCMDQAIISVIAEMEARIRELESKLAQLSTTTNDTTTGHTKADQRPGR